MKYNHLAKTLSYFYLSSILAASSTLPDNTKFESNIFNRNNNMITSAAPEAARTFNAICVTNSPLDILASFNAITILDEMKEALYWDCSKLICKYLYEEKLCRAIADVNGDIQELESAYVAVVFSLSRTDYDCSDIQFQNHYDLYIDYSKRRKHRTSNKGF